MGDDGLFRRSRRSDRGLPAARDHDWLALDIETANSARGSICSVGVALVRDGEVIATGEQLVNPECEFSGYNRAIHGIDERAVRDAPTFAEVWPTLYGLLDGRLMVAHYASFDVGGLRQAVAQHGLTGPTLEVVCSWRLAKVAWPEMPSHSLGWVGPAVGVYFDHHAAGADAEAAARVVLAACDAHSVGSLGELLEVFGFRPGRLTPDSFVGMSALMSAGAPGLHRMEGDSSADPDHPLYGSTVCFTGGLLSMPRHDAADALVEVGATFVDNMSAKVDFLVIGDADFVGFADGHRTGKIEKLMHLRDTGKAHTEVVGERDFLALLHG